MPSGPQPCNHKCRRGQSSVSRGWDLWVPVKPPQCVLAQSWWNVVLDSWKASLGALVHPWCNHIFIHPKLPMSSQRQQRSLVSEHRYYGWDFCFPFSLKSACSLIDLFVKGLKPVQSSSFIISLYWNLATVTTKNPSDTCIVLQKYYNC